MSNDPKTPDGVAGSGAASAADSVIAVDICGHRYNIRGQYEETRIRELAAYVDRRMRQVGRQLGHGDMVRVAVMAALNIADDYSRTRRASEQRDEVVDETARRLSARIDAALESVD